MDSEFNKDLLYISAPIFDHTGRAQAAHTIVTFSQGQSPELLERNTLLMKENAAAWSREMGYMVKEISD